MKRLMILGAGPNQIPLIKAAKKNGYYVIACDYNENAPGVKLADELCLASIMDRDAVLEKAKELKLDGIISNSEPAMPIVAYVGNALGLPSNDYETVAAMTNKFKFRTLLKQNGFTVPGFGVADSLEKAKELFNGLNKPVLIKPAASSGSRGVVKVFSEEQLKPVFDDAVRYSRTNEVILEEYIDNTCSHLIAGDIFVQDEKVIFWGAMDSLRGEPYPFNPLGEAYPPDIDDKSLKAIKDEISTAVKKLHIKFSAINIEVIIDRDGKVCFIELNPRNGGNRIPEALIYSTGFDVFDATVRAAVGETVQAYEPTADERPSATYMVHSMQTGVLKSVSFSEELKKYIRDYYPDEEPGASVEPFVNSDKRIGVLVMVFDSVQQRNEIMANIEDHVFVEVE
ncbi:MAG: ATP-grasp domain-containing protein [Bacillota bacterium]|nr:ATP-grasp domain-containing protein [Bacillota bacterium]